MVDVENTAIKSLDLSGLFQCQQVWVSNCPGMVILNDFIPRTVKHVQAMGDSCKKFNFSAVADLLQVFLDDNKGVRITG